MVVHDTAPVCAHCPMMFPPCPYRASADGCLRPPPDPPPLPDCPHRGRVIDTGGGCACGETRLCGLLIRVVGRDDCAACEAPRDPP